MACRTRSLTTASLSCESRAPDDALHRRVRGTACEHSTPHWERQLLPLPRVSRALHPPCVRSTACVHA